MELMPVTRINQINEGDTLIIDDGKKLIPAKAKIVKVTDHDGTEVIFRIKKNRFFNVGMYLDGKSWAKKVCIVHKRDFKTCEPHGVFPCRECGTKHYDGCRCTFCV